ncbi:hypothetical protein N5D61_15730 [Pseudomonas sp. GD03842]|uniref:hypothetical protein n=1 Tax=unclassified Pseudomonas TaxID=196821 RepID=UPI000D3AF8BE|nr:MULTISPECIES: hypothetical protein [unclassified Pseudomonas]MDH0747786.1 hypothetical protein [Pseudomonas sp. GD03842]RAU40322.1 hypothetical protein DBP26_024510 [Pseudomonas sp. RIT 409]RAU55521.1 hypothetical protein DBY65_006375 [Pseudomonas sp. RIT 412]
MRTHTLKRLLTAAVLVSTYALISSTAMAAGDVEGSALPPGVNPSSPAGGNGGDAQGYEKRSAVPDPPGSAEKISPKSKTSAPRVPVDANSAPHEKSTVKKP